MITSDLTIGGLVYMLNREELRQIRKREREATKGPWRWGDISCHFGELEDAQALFTLESHEAPRVPVIRHRSQICKTVLEIDDHIGDNDRDFIMHARTDIPLLVATIEHLENEIGELRRTLEYYASKNEDYGLRAKTALRRDE